ncbi:MAG: 1-acyl-sn-glycerol-3-phosphate acyltransferase [Planctomycetota bacterium]|nr:MAG: 1-acyl-sn-glycerol-3-phosphate acyltransferase [Planctomycetota bacterium]
MLMFKIRHVGTRHVPRKGPALLVSNHQSFMDPPLVGMPLSRECCFMARDSLFRNPLFTWLIVKLNAFPVSRNTADISAIKKSLRLLKQGKIVVLFPEGTRTNNGKIQPMLPGFCGIAKKTKVPIIPTLIDGAFQAWPRNRLLPRPGRIIVEYAPPIRPNQYQNLTAEQMMEQIRNRIIAMQYHWHSRLPQQRLEWYGSCNEQNDIIRS